MEDRMFCKTNNSVVVFVFDGEKLCGAFMPTAYEIHWGWNITKHPVLWVWVWNCIVVILISMLCGGHGKNSAVQFLRALLTSAVIIFIFDCLVMCLIFYWVSVLLPDADGHTHTRERIQLLAVAGRAGWTLLLRLLSCFHGPYIRPDLTTFQFVGPQGVIFELQSGSKHLQLPVAIS